MSNEESIEITKTSFNLVAIVGWLGILFGLAAGLLQFYQPDYQGVVSLAIGLIGGGLGVTFAGPIKTVTTTTVVLNRKNSRRPENV